MDFIVNTALRFYHIRLSAVWGELSYLAPLGSENISARYFNSVSFGGGYSPPDSQTPRLPVPRQK